MNFNALTNPTETTTTLDATLVPDTNRAKKIEMANIGKYILNNWRDKDPEDILLQAFADKNMAIYITNEGDFAYRIGLYGKITFLNDAKFKRVAKNILGFSIKIDDDDNANNLDTTKLMMVSRDIFDPFQEKEFFTKEDETFRNTFRATKYMGLKLENAKDPKAIRSLILHLVNGKKKRYDWFINWMASHYQTFKRPTVACILKGRQGAGKGILVMEVLSPLFGEEQVVNIGDKAIRSGFIGSMFEGKMFINLDEISHSSKDNQQLKNLLKQIVTNDSVQMEQKYKDMNMGIKLHGLVLITTNEPQALSVEHNDRRYTIYSTGNNLNTVDYLGYGSYESLSRAIKDELEDFASLLNNYKVDFNKANTAEDTLEKEALIGVTNNRFIGFYNAIINKNIAYFEDLKDDSLSAHYYSALVDDFSHTRVSRKNLHYYFGLLEQEDISSSKLLKQLRTIDPELFDEKLNTIGSSDGDKLFLLDGHPKKGEKLALLQLDLETDTVQSIVTAPNIPCNNIILPVHPSMVMQ